MSSAKTVKICGVTQEAEIEALARLGVDYFGLVIGLDVDYALTSERAAVLVAHAGSGPRGTIVTKERNTDKLAALVDLVGAPAIQLAGFTSVARVARLRRRFDPSSLTIMQVIHFQGGAAVEQAYIDDYAEAGVDFFIVDGIGRDGALGSTGEAIDKAALIFFRDSKNSAVPTLVAGGVEPANVQALMNAAGAVGVDVFSSVRTGSGVDVDKVKTLIEAMP